MKPPPILSRTYAIIVAGLLLTGCDPRLDPDELEDRLIRYDWKVTRLSADTLLLADSTGWDGSRFDYTSLFEGQQLVFTADGRFTALTDTASARGVWQTADGRKPPRTFLTLSEARPEWKGLLDRRWKLNVNFERELNFAGDAEPYDVRLKLEAY